MDFEYDDAAVANADKAADRLTENGAYVGEFTDVFGFETDSGAKGLEFHFHSPGVGDAITKVYTYGKDGSKTFGFDQVQALMFLLNVKSLKSTKGKVQAWGDNSDGKRVLQEQEGDTYPALCKKPIGVVLQKELYTTGKGSTGERLNFYGAFQAETKLMASEIKAKSTKPIKLDRVLKGLKVKDGRKAAAAEPDQPGMGAVPDGGY